MNDETNKKISIESKNERKTVKVYIHLDDFSFQRLNQICEETGKTKTALIEEIVDSVMKLGYYVYGHSELPSLLEKFYSCTYGRNARGGRIYCNILGDVPITRCKDCPFFENKKIYEKPFI